MTVYSEYYMNVLEHFLYTQENNNGKTIDFLCILRIVPSSNMNYVKIGKLGDFSSVLRLVCALASLYLNVRKTVSMLLVL